MSVPAPAMSTASTTAQTNKRAFLFAPVCDERDRSGLVARCQPHCIPYGVILEEYAHRRPDDLTEAATCVLGCDPEAQDHAMWNDVRARRASLRQKADELQTVREGGNATSEENQKLEEEYRAAHESFRELVWNSLRISLAHLDAAYDELERKKAGKEKTKAGSISPYELDKLQAACERADRPLRLLLHRLDGHALCFSGGGIRSASFCLGVLEGLARFSLGLLAREQPKKRADDSSGLLHRLDYLSTVSGGGYTGSWLTAWIHRRCYAAVANERHALRHAYDALSPTGADPAARLQKQAAIDLARANLESAARSRYKSCYREVIDALAGEAPETSGDPAPAAIRHVREYTSYLAPALGLTLDSWTLLAIVLRNLFINWLMLVPLLIVVVAIPQVVYYASQAFALAVFASNALRIFYGVLSVALFVYASWFAAHNLPSHRDDEGLRRHEGPPLSETLISFALPVLLANWLLVELWWSVNLDTQGAPGWAFVTAGVLLLSGIGLAFLCRGIFVSDMRRLEKSAHSKLAYGDPRKLRSLQFFLAGAASAVVATSLGCWFYTRVLPAVAQAPVVPWSDERLLVMLGLPLVTLIPLLTVSVLSGLLGTFEKEEDREWWSRAGAVQLAAISGWTAALAIALYGGAIHNVSLPAVAGFGASGGLLGLLGSALGWSGKTSPGPVPVKAEQVGKVGSFLNKHDLLLPTICGLALLLLALGAANLEVILAEALPWFGGSPLAAHGLVLLIALALGFAINRAISINLFSLNGLYRMRLMRAFLGASNIRRHADLFTGFDPHDTPVEYALPDSPGVPLHLINTTLNLVGTKNTAWRQRKAEPFSFSPLHSGSWRVGYVPSRYYAGADGPTLATTMTISGAAFNPNMGYHSSALVTLMMTFFNVRLGWWLPNPAREEGGRGLLQLPLFKHWSPTGEDFLRRNGPSFALEPLILEAFGQTDDRYRWIELTDGGHFENLGLYEMVMRRCKKIIVVDAGADPKCQFEDLGNAIRKIHIDLGIPIRFRSLPFREGADTSNRYCAVADIDYGCVDGQSGLSSDEARGILIYIKAAITGNEPPDVKQYSMTHETFPHEATANQFFNEAQFESYRHLASFAIEQIAAAGDGQSGKATVPSPMFGPSDPEPPQVFDFDAWGKASTAHSLGGSHQDTLPNYGAIAHSG